MRRWWQEELLEVGVTYPDSTSVVSSDPGDPFVLLATDPDPHSPRLKESQHSKERFISDKAECT